MKSPLDPDNLEDHNRTVIAVLFALIILLSWQLFFAEKPPAPGEIKRQQQIAAGTAEAAPRPRADVLAGEKRVPVRGDKLTGSLPLKGARIDDLLLNDHYTTPQRTARQPLFSPSGATGAFYAESGWVSEDKGVALPSNDTVWTLDAGSARELAGGGAPVRFTWDNGQGLVFTREIALDHNYLFTITQGVRNDGAAAVKLSPYYLTARAGLPHDHVGAYTQHEGPIGRLNGKLQDPQYKSVAGGDKIEASGVQGWLGMSDKYWMALILPEPSRKFDARVTGEQGVLPHFQADIVGSAVEVPAGGAVSDKVNLFAGAKAFDVMKSYETQYGFDRIEDAVDFGMWFFITKPFYALFRFLVDAFGNVGAAILAMTVIVRAVMFPLASKAFVSMAKMKALQPQLKELQEKYKGADRAVLQEHIMALYQKENANPFSGCWPMIVQIPIFFALYKVILISVELRHAPFWGWIDDLSAPDPTSIFNLFGLIPWTPPQLLTIGVWPILFCITMILQKRLTPPMPDPIQEKVQSYFPYIFTVMLAHFAVGLVIYWTWSNILAVAQQTYIANRVAADGEKVSVLRGHHARRKPKHPTNNDT